MSEQWNKWIKFEREVMIDLDDDGTLLAWLDGEMQDGMDYEPYGAVLASGKKTFDQVCRAIVKELKS